MPINYKGAQFVKLGLLVWVSIRSGSLCNNTNDTYLKQCVVIPASNIKKNIGII